MRTRTAAIALAGLSVSMLSVSSRAAQQPLAPQQSQPPVFRGTSELVEIDAVVTDQNGGVVRGLTQHDFQVTEDGKPQELVQFSFVDIPAPHPGAAPARSAPTTVRPDVSVNAPPTESRLYVIVLDGLHVDVSRSTVVRRQARQFIDEYMGPNDMAALMLFGRTRSNQQFTSDKNLLIAAVDQFVGQKTESATAESMQDVLLRPQHDRPSDDQEGLRNNQARIMLESIRQVCQSLGTTQGHRRAVVLFSEGIDFDTTDLIGQDQRPSAGGQGSLYESSKHASLVLQAEQDLFVAARRANVALYTIDPRGGTSGEDTAITLTSAPGTALMQEVQRSQGTLRTMAEQTGGLAVVNTNNLSAGFAQIVQSNSSYYVLGYRPSTVADGAYHKISVTVNRPHVEVIARKGYYAPLDAKEKPASAGPPASAPGPNAASPRMRELLASSLPVSGLGLRVTGGPVRSQDGKMLVALVVEIDTRDLPFVEQNGVLSNDIEMAFLAMDAQGRMQAANRSVGNLHVPSADRAGVTNGLRYVVEFPVAPGHYQVRVAAHESAGDRGGSALFDVEALDPAKTPLSIGTIFLTSTTAQAVPTTGSFPVVKSLLSAPPTTRREFTRSDALMAYANVCDAEAGKAHTVEITTSVVGADGREAFRVSVTKPGAELSLKANGFGYTSNIPLTGFAPGAYVLTIDARASTGKSSSRSMAFVVH